MWITDGNSIYNNNNNNDNNIYLITLDFNYEIYFNSTIQRQAAAHSYRWPRMSTFLTKKLYNEIWCTINYLRMISKRSLTINKAWEFDKFFLILSRLPRAVLSCARALIAQGLAASYHSSTDICLSIFGIGSKYLSLISRWQQQQSFNDSYTALILEDTKSSTLH